MERQSTKQLSSLSWQSIQGIYAILGQRMQEYNDLQKRIGIPGTVDINFPDDKNILILRFWRDVTKVNEEIKLLDAEIARRNKLIGVMG